ncbi:DnaJ domain-containing protein [Kiloniella sp. b19]|uniref:DnaJ domain-containing protein n=1 Tax=Kiloniella sp. GXU_MW_B19 TaxID=3141326 RepID=UPI0031DD9E50
MTKEKTNPHLMTDWDRRKDYRRCDVEGCEEAGEYRAPKSRDSLRDYYWFCLDHVRAYNASWDFCKGMSPDEIDRMRRDDVTWNKATWPMGNSPGAGLGYRGKAGQASARSEAFQEAWDRFAEDLSFKSDSRNDRKTSGQKRERAAPSLPQIEQEALQALGLGKHPTARELKKHYLDLVKEHHPDRNPGRKDAEERLKTINQAYALLRESSFLQPDLQSQNT